MVAPIRWRAGAEVVSPWAFRIGLPKSVRKGLLSYSDRAGISDLFRHVTYRGNSLSPGTEGVVDLHGLNWLLQRPPSDWKSNLHWLSPADGSTHKNYLESLSFAGFDQVLEGIGEYLGLEGLVAFHVTFIAVSLCMSGYEHHDVEWTGGKTFNIIIPLLLASETGPELELLEGASYFDDHNASEYHDKGRYRYEYDIATMMGDGAVHATSAVDYRSSKQMRLAATVYVADVNDDNVDGILEEYTQMYPPRHRNLLLSWAGRHWSASGASRRLPIPSETHALIHNAT